MFKNGKNNEEDYTGTSSTGKSMNHFGSGTIIEGEIKSQGDVRIDGKIIGTITTNAKLVIGQSGHIEGDIFCQDAIIEGKIIGKVEVGQILRLKSTAIIQGDIVTSKLVVEEGSKFNGTCKMGGRLAKTELNGEAKIGKKENKPNYEAEVA